MFAQPQELHNGWYLIHPAALINASDATVGVNACVGVRILWATATRSCAAMLAQCYNRGGNTFHGAIPPKRASRLSFVRRHTIIDTSLPHSSFSMVFSIFTYVL
jgi:hypothetical protein